MNRPSIGEKTAASGRFAVGKPESSRRRLFLGGAGFFVAFILSLPAFGACDPKAANSRVSWTVDIEPLLHNCRSCHEFDPPEGLLIAPGLTYHFVVNIPSVESPLMRIEAGNPELSYMIHKLRGTHADVGGSGAQMPIGFDLWTGPEIQLLMDWIGDCSPNN